jgi:poly [ADP-ribose] polymerase
LTKFQDDEEIGKIDISSSTSKLAKSVQDLVRLIFDVESMKKAMLEFEVTLLLAV